MSSKSFKCREFLKTSAVLFTTVVAGSSFAGRRYQPLLSFSTLGCPDWPFEEIVSFAAANSYSAIEIRGIQRELDLTKAIPFSSKQNIADSIKLMQDNNLKFANLGSSASVTFFGRSGAAEKFG